MNDSVCARKSSPCDLFVANTADNHFDGLRKIWRSTTVDLILKRIKHNDVVTLR